MYPTGLDLGFFVGCGMSTKRLLPLVLSLALAAAGTTLRASEPIDLSPGPHNGATQTVAVGFDLGGDLLFDGQNMTEEALPVSASAQLSYHELAASDGRTSVRFYDTIEVRTEVAGRVQQPDLPASRRLVRVTMQEDELQLSAVEGVLQRQELDLLQTAADSLALDRLAPTTEIQVGDSWQLEPGSVKAVIGLDSVGICEVTGVLSEANSHYARCQVAGTVHGVVRGSSTELDIDAVYLFDRRARHVTRLNLAIREIRTVGPATPGLNGVAKVRVKVDPVEGTSSLTPDLVAKALNDGPFDGLALIETRNDRLGFACIHDDHWYSIAGSGSAATLRRVTSGGLVAHGNVAKLPPVGLNTRTALGAFRSDVLRSLGNDAAGVASEEQWTNQHGCRVMAVVVAGAISGANVEWHAYQVAPPANREDLHRLAITFTVEQSELERLAGTDRSLVDSIELLPIATFEAKLPGTKK